VQDCLTKVKANRKMVVRYIQLVDMDEGGDFIGALIATNEQVSWQLLPDRPENASDPETA
jgi:hypothetical protein